MLRYLEDSREENKQWEREGRQLGLGHSFWFTRALVDFDQCWDPFPGLGKAVLTGAASEATEIQVQIPALPFASYLTLDKSLHVF